MLETELATPSYYFLAFYDYTVAWSPSFAWDFPYKIQPTQLRIVKQG